MIVKTRALEVAPSLWRNAFQQTQKLWAGLSLEVTYRHVWWSCSKHLSDESLCMLQWKQSHRCCLSGCAAAAKPEGEHYSVWQRRKTLSLILQRCHTPQDGMCSSWTGDQIIRWSHSSSMQNKLLKVITPPCNPRLSKRRLSASREPQATKELLITNIKAIKSNDSQHKQKLQKFVTR